MWLTTLLTRVADPLMIQVADPLLTRVADPLPSIMTSRCTNPALALQTTAHSHMNIQIPAHSQISLVQTPALSQISLVQTPTQSPISLVQTPAQSEISLQTPVQSQSSLVSDSRPITGHSPDPCLQSTDHPPGTPEQSPISLVQSMISGLATTRSTLATATSVIFSSASLQPSAKRRRLTEATQCRG